jgi:hypothetical protein
MIPQGIRNLTKALKRKSKPSEDHSEEFKHLMRMKKDDLFVLAAEHDCEIPPGATKAKLTNLILDKKTLDNH